MDKNKITNLLLILLPLVAVVLAGMPNAVTIYALSGEERIVTYCSFFTYVEDVGSAICLPFAGICGAVTFGMAVLYLVKKTAFWLKGIAVASFAAMTLAVMPVLARAETHLIPNMLVPILMLAVCLMAYGMLKSPAQGEEKKNKTKTKLLKH